jgi:hypothetical protein
MDWHVYLRGNVVFVPTTGALDIGVYREIEPVAVVPLSNTDGVRLALKETVARGNPPAQYSPGNFPPPVLLKYAGVKTWSAFARGTLTWTIEQTESHYQIVGYQKSAKGYWERDPNQTIAFPAATSADDVIDRLIEIMQNAATKQRQ